MVSAEAEAEGETEGEGMAGGKSSNCSDPKGAVWDCESRLYDSFELRGFLKHLGVAVAAVSTLKPHSPYHLRSPLYSPLHRAGCLANLAFPRRKGFGKAKIRGADRHRQAELPTDLEVARRSESAASPCKSRREGNPKSRSTRFPRLLQRLFKPFRSRGAPP